MVENFHWTYEQIDNTPYSRLQELFVILSVKNDAREAQGNKERAQSEARQMAKTGGKKTFYREV